MVAEEQTELEPGLEPGSQPEESGSKPGKKPEKSKRKPARVHARLISHAGQTALVEWIDKGSFRRAYIPADEYDFLTSRVDLDVLETGVPYGVDWSRMELSIDPVALREELYRVGIWTRDDIRRNPEVVHAAINRISGMMRADLERYAESLESSGRTQK